MWSTTAYLVVDVHILVIFKSRWIYFSAFLFFFSFDFKYINLVIISSAFPLCKFQKSFVELIIFLPIWLLQCFVSTLGF